MALGPEMNSLSSSFLIFSVSGFHTRSHLSSGAHLSYWRGFTVAAVGAEEMVHETQVGPYTMKSLFWKSCGHARHRDFSTFSVFGIPVAPGTFPSTSQRCNKDLNDLSFHKGREGEVCSLLQRRYEC